MCVCLSKRIKKQNFFSMFVCSRNKYWKKNSNMGKNQSKWGKKQMFLFLSINSIRFIARNEKMNKKIDEEYSSKKINIDESNSNTHMAHTCPSSMIVLGENIKIPIFSNATVLLWWFFSSLFSGTYIHCCMFHLINFEIVTYVNRPWIKMKNGNVLPFIISKKVFNWLNWICMKNKTKHHTHT